MKNHKLLFIFNLLFFILSFININFAMLGFLCMTIPFILLYKTKKNTFCTGYCPRSNLITKTKHIKWYQNLKTPKVFITGNIKWYILSYMLFNLILMTIAVIRITFFDMIVLEQMKLFNLIDLPFHDLLKYRINPQLTQISFSLFNMMLSTTLLGIILGLIYKPKTWCSICPVMTMQTTIKNKL